MSAVARYEPRELGAHELAALERQCDKFARSTLVPKALQGKPNDLMAIALTARSLGMELSLPAINQFHVIEGRVEPSGQLCLGLVKSAGHTARMTEYSEERATVTVRRAGSDETETFTFTIEMARKAGLLDQWVEHRVEDGVWEDSGRKKYKTERFVLGREGVDEPAWVKKEVAAGNLKRRENWFNYPADMLAAKAAKRAARFAAPEVLFGMASLHWDAADGEPPPGVDAETGEMHQDPSALDDEPTDGELVDDTPPPPGGAAKGAGPSAGSAPDAAADDWDRQALHHRIIDLGEEFRAVLRPAWEAEGFPKIDGGTFTKDQVSRAELLVSKIGELAKAEWKKRQKRANALLGEIGVKGDDARHAAIREATGGETESTGRLSSTQIDAVVAWVDGKKAEAAQGEWDDPDAGQRDDEPPVQDELSADEF